MYVRGTHALPHIYALALEHYAYVSAKTLLPVLKLIYYIYNYIFTYIIRIYNIYI